VTIWRKRRPQTANLHINGAFIDKRAVAPDFIKQLRPGKDTLRMRHEKSQQAKLGWFEKNRIVTPEYPMRHRVKRKRASSQGLLRMQ